MKGSMVKGLVEQARGMKTMSSVKKRCEGCKVRVSFLVVGEQEVDEGLGLQFNCRMIRGLYMRFLEQSGGLESLGKIGESKCCWRIMLTIEIGCEEERRE
jgi:hypothetical protein